MQIVIISNEDERKEFINEVGEEILPEEYGGRAKLVAIQDFEVTPLENGRTNWLKCLLDNQTIILEYNKIRGILCL